MLVQVADHAQVSHHCTDSGSSSVWALTGAGLKKCRPASIPSPQRRQRRQLFRSAVGESPISYLLHRRMEAAKELLVMSDATVAAVAKATGFDNPYYFCRMFKKCVAFTPSQHRLRHRAALGRGNADALRL